MSLSFIKCFLLKFYLYFVKGIDYFYFLDFQVKKEFKNFVVIGLFSNHCFADQYNLANLKKIDFIIINEFRVNL